VDLNESESFWLRAVRDVDIIDKLLTRQKARIVAGVIDGNVPENDGVHIFDELLPVQSLPSTIMYLLD
jgi:hypothetical protein